MSVLLISVFQPKILPDLFCEEKNLHDPQLMTFIICRPSPRLVSSKKLHYNHFALTRLKSEIDPSRRLGKAALNDVTFILIFSAIQEACCLGQFEKISQIVNPENLKDLTVDGLTLVHLCCQSTFPVRSATDSSLKQRKTRVRIECSRSEKK